MTADRDHGDDLRGASRLVVEATKGVTTAVEQMHRAIADGPGGIARPLTLPGRLVAGMVYGSVRGVASLVGAGLDVFKSEPNYDTRVNDLPNTFLLPHVGTATVETRTRMANMALDNVEAVLSGRPAPYPATL